ncbi:actin [Aphomia sociella]
MSFEKPVVVIDNGSFNIKAGFACDNHPVCMFRSAVGRPSYLKGKYGHEPYDVFIGDEAVAKSEDLELSHPIRNGQIVHWDNMERIWHHIFYRELKVAPEDRAVILACSVTTPMEEKIKCCEIFFETLNAPALCVQPQAVLSMYGAGHTTGISVDMGHDTTNINPIYEGGLIRHAHLQTKLAGAQISNVLKEYLDDRNYNFGIKSEEIMEEIKRKLYVSLDCSMSRLDYQRTFTLPSGEEIDVSQEAFMAGELIFQPDFIKGTSTNYMPLHEAVVTSALKCDAEMRSEMYEVIVPCGGLAMIPGLADRLAAEVEGLTHRPVNILSSPEGYVTTWLGGATFAGLPDSEKMWVSKKQFEDYGAKIVRNKFL